MQHAPYILTAASWGAGFVYPPTALPVVALFDIIGVDAWRAANAIALATVSLLIVRQERGGLSALAFLATLAYLAINPFVWSAWANAQITPALVALMGAGYLYPQIAGPAAAIGGAVKIYPGALVLWAYRVRGWPGVRDAAVVGVLVILVSWPIVGSLWPDFFVAARNALPSCNVGLPDSLRCQIGEPYGQPVSLLVGGAVSLLSLVIRDRRIAFAFLMFGVMLMSPDLNSAYWLLPSFGLLPALAGMAPSLGGPVAVRSPQP